MKRLLNAARWRLRNWFISDRTIIRRQYRLKVGRSLDLRNPSGLHEKICWLQLNRLTPLHSFCTDKITVSAYIASRVGTEHLVRRYLVARTADDVKPECIPARACVLKTNHDSGGVFIVADTEKADWDTLRARLRKRLRRNHYRGMRERQYKSIRPGIIAEELVTTDDGGLPGDLKMFCINGKVAFIRHIIEGLGGKFAEDADDLSSRQCIVDRNWAMLDINRLENPFIPTRSEKPKHLDEMIWIAERLAEPFPFVRVDFLLAGDRFYTGELTFSPSAGYASLIPYSRELEYGAMLDHMAAPPDWKGLIAAARLHDAAFSVRDGSEGPDKAPFRNAREECLPTNE